MSATQKIYKIYKIQLKIYKSWGFEPTKLTRALEELHTSVNLILALTLFL